MKKKTPANQNKEFFEAIELLEKEKGIPNHTVLARNNIFIKSSFNMYCLFSGWLLQSIFVLPLLKISYLWETVP